MVELLRICYLEDFFLFLLFNYISIVFGFGGRVDDICWGWRALVMLIFLVYRKRDYLE